MQIDTLFERAKLPDGTLASIAVANGRISAIATDPAKAPSATEKVDLAGALVVPGFVEGHIHLDTSFIGDNWKPHRPCINGLTCASASGSRRRTWPPRRRCAIAP